MQFTNHTDPNLRTYTYTAAELHNAIERARRSEPIDQLFALADNLDIIDLFAHAPMP